MFPSQRYKSAEPLLEMIGDILVELMKSLFREKKKRKK